MTVTMKWAFLLLLALQGSCAVVKPWEREVLSQRCMTPGAEKSEDKFRQHWQFSREGAEGGFGAAGGGCGCN
jgi:hypothetical protein